MPDVWLSWDPSLLAIHSVLSYIINSKPVYAFTKMCIINENKFTFKYTKRKQLNIKAKWLEFFLVLHTFLDNICISFRWLWSCMSLRKNQRLTVGTWSETNHSVLLGYSVSLIVLRHVLINSIISVWSLTH